MKLSLLLVLVVLVAVCFDTWKSAAFITSSSSSSSLPLSGIRRTTCTGSSSSSSRCHPLFAAATKKTTKKKAVTSKKKQEEEAEAEAVVESGETSFRKAEFISSIQAKTGLSKADSEAALAAVLDTITEEVASGKRVSMLGFGTFKLSHRAARKGRNPRTGEEIEIAASFTPSFTASKAFKEKVNQ